MSSEKENSVRVVVEQIWNRARINAFAHRTAADEASDLAKKFFRREITAILLSILCVIAVYLLSTDTDQTSSFIKYSKAGFTFLSITLTLYALYQSVMEHYLKLDVRAQEHHHLLNSYQYIAQRAREVKWPDLPYADLTALLKDLERDFQLLKARGREPADRHFDKAHEIVRKIRGDKEIQIAQSFEVGVNETAAQQAGMPNKPKN